VHRDLPENILVNDASLIKIIDFGSARRLHSDESDSFDYTHEVQTLWYRAPEVLLGQCIPGGNSYGAGVDIWSVGAVLAELLGGAPLFPAQSEIDLIGMIRAVVPDPTHCWTAVDHKLRRAETVPTTTLSEVTGIADPEALDLLSKLLTMDPATRLTAQEALAHPYFRQWQSYREEGLTPTPFDFPRLKQPTRAEDPEDRWREDLRDLVWAEIREFNAGMSERKDAARSSQYSRGAA